MLNFRNLSLDWQHKANKQFFSHSLTAPCSAIKYGRTYIFSLRIIPAYLTYRQEAAKGGIRSMAEELLWNVQTNARNRTVNHKTASTALRRLNPAQTSIQLVLFIHTIPDTFLSYFYVSYGFSLFLWYPQWTETCKANSFSYS